MSRSSDLSKLTHKISMTYHQDGLVDIVAGAAIMGLGAWYFNASTFVAFVSLLPFIFFARLKNWIAAPRLGMLKIDPDANASGLAKILMVILSVALLIVTGLGILGRDRSISFFMQPFPALAVVTVLLLAVIATGMPARFGGAPIFWYARVIMYVAIYLFVIVADLGFRITNGVFVVASGTIILTAGLGQLLVFLSRNPVSKTKK